MTVEATLAELGYAYEPADIDVMGVFHAAVRTGNLVFTSGNVPSHGGVDIKGKVGGDLNVEAGQKAAELCAYNCLRAIGAVADINSIVRIVKVLGMVNVADGFDNTSGVINGASHFLTRVFGEDIGKHARSAVGMVIPANWAVEVEMVVEVA